MPFRLAARSAAVVLLLACAREHRSDTAQDSTQAHAQVAADTAAATFAPANPAPLDSVSGSLVTWAVEALALVSGGDDLTSWRSKFPRDSIARFSRRETRRFPNSYGGEAFPLGSWCARATARAKFGDGPAVLRRAYFYPTPPAPGVTLPGTDDAQRFMATECRLGLVLIHVLEPNQERGRGLAWVLRQDMQQRFGEGPALAQMSWEFSRPRGTAWLVGSTGLGATYIEFESTHSSSNGNEGEYNVTDEDWRGLVALAYRSHPTIGDAKLWQLDEDDDPPRQDPAAMLRLGIEGSGLDDATSAHLRGLFASLNVAVAPAEGGGGPFAIDSFAPLAPWLATAVGLPPERQAAALFAADVVLQMASQRRLLPTDSVTRARLDGLGAALTYNPFQKEYFYVGGLRRRAFELRPPGQLGDTLFSMMVQHAPTCTSLGWIVAEAERHAGSARTGLMRSTAYLVAARALADTFVISGSPALRERALERYQTALSESQYDRDTQQRAWFEGWRLAVGLAPLRLRYYCSVPD